MNPKKDTLDLNKKEFNWESFDFDRFFVDANEVGEILRRNDSESIVPNLSAKSAIDGRGL